ncbi:MAG: hypothetical protein AAGJ40_14320 [Planctomycetota bacterium]
MNRIAGLILLSVVQGNIGDAEISAQDPSFLVALADAHVESLGSKPEDLEKAREHFCACFRWGYTSFAEAEIPADSIPIDVAGYNAAVRYRKRHPESLERVLTAFGYKKEIHVGVWRTGHEMSQFLNENVRKPGWWVGYCPKCEKPKLNWKRFPKLPADRDVPAKLRKLIDDGRGAEAKVRVTGYLSPVGKYGHLGSYSRELLATSIQPIDQPTSVTKNIEGTRNRDDAYRSYDGQPHPPEGINEPSDAPKDRSSRFDNGELNAGPR